MSDVSKLPFTDHVSRWIFHRAKVKLQGHLLALWRTNTAFKRVVEMDKIMVVNRGESFYCTRFIDETGETEYEGHMGPLKGDAIPGSYVKFTHHHSVCYPGWRNLYAGLTSAGYHFSHEQWNTLRSKGLIYATNGMDNRLHWTMQVDRKLSDLLNKAGYKVEDQLHDKGQRVKVGDYLCVVDTRESVTVNGYESRELMILVSRIRSKEYGNERFRSLHSLS